MKDKHTIGFITTKQAAKLTGYTTDYIGQLARDGHLESFKDGRERLVKVEDLFSYVNSKTETTTEKSKDNAVVAKPVSTPEAPVASPWIKYEIEDDQELLPELNKKEDVTAPAMTEGASGGKAKPRFTKIDYQGGSGAAVKTKELGPKLQLLPALNTTTMSLAVFSFILTILFGASYILPQLDFTVTEYSYAAATQSGFWDYVAVSWYDFVNSILGLDG